MHVIKLLSCQYLDLPSKIVTTIDYLNRGRPVSCSKIGQTKEPDSKAHLFLAKSLIESLGTRAISHGNETNKIVDIFVIFSIYRGSININRVLI